MKCTAVARHHAQNECISKNSIMAVVETAGWGVVVVGEVEGEVIYGHAL